MRYEEFRDRIRAHLKDRPDGATWPELKARLKLPQRTACYSWVYRMQDEIGLKRTRGPQGSLWTLRKPPRSG
jgi:hypothetical protein